MRGPWFWLLSATLLAASPLRGEEPVPVPAAAAIGQMCSPAGAYQFAFGQTGVPGADRLTRTVSEGIALPASLAPFDRVEPWATEWSDRLFAVEYTAPDPDDAAFAALFAQLESALGAAGWELQPEEFDPPLYMATIAGERTWLRPVEAQGGTTQLVVGLSRYAGRMTLGCGRADLMRAHVSEALGDLPAGTPRPVLPEVPVPALRNEADCGRPEIVKEMENLLRSSRLDAFMAAMVARTTYRDRLTAWMTWKLEESGKTTSDDLIDLLLTSSGDVSPDGNPFAQFEMFDELIQVVGRVAEAQDSGEPMALCRSLLPLHDWATRVDALTLRQTEAAQAALAAEAARLGVSLD